MSTILDFADKLRSQVDIADVVGRYVDLRRMGTNMKGLCPFHSEKTPSFTISTSKQIFHCFGCHEGGDIIKFVQKIERLEWMDAVRHLSKEYNIPMPELRSSPRESAEARDAKTAALDATRFAMELFSKNLRHQVGQGHEIREYLNRRGLGPEILERFQLGLAPDAWTALMDAATKSGHTPDSLLNAGLVIKNTEKNRIYDRFRKRLIFPIHDTHGTPVAFGARVFASDASPDEPKYINSPETLAYHKGQALYALHVAKDAIVKEETAILMEGYMDVIRAHVHGVTNAVASCGTALTDEQARTLKRFCTRVVFVYDGDEAGQKAMLRGTETLLDQGFNVAVVSLPDGHDPDSFLTEKGADAFRELVDKARNFFEHFLTLALQRFDTRTAEGKVQAVELLLPLLRRVQKPIARNDYARRLADRLQVDTILIQRQLSDNNPRSLDRLRATMTETQNPRESVVETTLLKLMVECPTARARIREKINPEWLRDTKVRKWFQICNHTQSAELTWEHLMNSDEVESEDEIKFLRSLAVLDEGCDSSEKSIEHVASRLQMNFRKESVKVVQREIDEFYQAGQPEDILNERLEYVSQNPTPVSQLRYGYHLKNNPTPERN